MLYVNNPSPSPQEFILQYQRSSFDLLETNNHNHLHHGSSTIELHFPKPQKQTQPVETTFLHHF